MLGKRCARLWEKVRAPRRPAHNRARRIWWRFCSEPAVRVSSILSVTSHYIYVTDSVATHANISIFDFPLSRPVSLCLAASTRLGCVAVVSLRLGLCSDGSEAAVLECASGCSLRAPEALAPIGLVRLRCQRCFSAVGLFTAVKFWSARMSELPDCPRVHNTSNCYADLIAGHHGPTACTSPMDRPAGEAARARA